MQVLYLWILGILLLGSGEKNSNKVYIFLSEECPISIHMTYPLSTIAESFDEDFEFIAVFPKSNSTLKTANTFLEAYHLERFKPVLDPKQKLTKKLGATITPEVVIEKGRKIKYRGRINDDYAAPGRKRQAAQSDDMMRAMKAILSGGDVPAPWPKAIGCFITFEK